MHSMFPKKHDVSLELPRKHGALELPQISKIAIRQFPSELQVIIASPGLFFVVSSLSILGHNGNINKCISSKLFGYSELLIHSV